MQRRELRAQREQSADESAERKLEISRAARNETPSSTNDWPTYAPSKRRPPGNKHSEVRVEWDTSNVPPPGIMLNSGDEVHAAYVHNLSGRPIRDVRAGIRLEPGTQYEYAQGYAMWKSPDPMTGGDQKINANFRVGVMVDQYGYIFLYGWSAARHVGAQLALRFIDDNSNEWQVNPDLTVSRLKPEEWTD